MQNHSVIYPLPFNTEFSREIGGLFIAGFEGKKARGEVVKAVRGGLGGVILFPRNLGSPKEILALTNGLQEEAGEIPLLISIDQEGGRVARLKAPFTEFPPMAALGMRNDPELARMAGQAIARELKAVGINLNFAPVLDLDTPGKDAVIGDRSLGADPEKISVICKAFIEGMQAEGVAACGKHFPGHGMTDRDSHKELPEVYISRDEIKPHLAPFAAAIGSDVASIMTAHIRCHTFDRYHPATLSRELLTGVLRSEMGFKGVIITDDMGMKGVADLLPAQDAAPLALRAGADMLLIAHDLGLAGILRDSVHESVRHMLLDPDDIMDKIERVNAMRKKFAPSKSRPALGVIGCREHRELVHEIAKC